MAQLYGKEAALLMVSGTMANLVALMLQCRSKGEAALIGNLTHINNWERGNIAACGSIMPITIQNHEDGTMDLEEAEFYCRAADPHLSVNKLLCLESTHNECNGRVLRMDYIK